MPLTGEDIRSRLVALAEKWSVYLGSERAEAQTFLNELFASYDQQRDAVATFEEPQAGGFIDLIWPRVCIIEMKRPSEAIRLDRHRDQAFRYWRQAADAERGIPAPKYVVLCAFKRFEVWEPGAYPEAPRAEFDLIELPDRYETLLFLAGREPVFLGGHEAITREAVGKLTDLYARLRERRAADADVLRDFCLQSVWCMFAEDLGQIEAQLFTRLVNRLIEDPQRSSLDEIGQLFTYLNTPGGGPDHGLYAGVRYANGGLFRDPARVHLDQGDLELLRAACQSDWTKVQPSIFGSLLEGGLGHDMQWALGAHYTHEADIRKVIGPSIIEPWEQRIDAISTHREAVQAQNDLANYVVLDPACGSGNFLYVAYQELRRIETRLREREQELRREAGMPDQQGLSFFPLTNIKGIEINGYAVAVARVTLWMGHKIAVDREGLDEATLPLANLSGIQQADALRTPWPECNVIIGNPPFHGDRNLRSLLGAAYLDWLRDEFNVGIKDYCVYWFRKAHDHLEQGQRAGLVGTNSVSQNRARGASLNYIVENDGVITDAVSTQDWPGEANVDVSIVNWIRAPDQRPSHVVLDAVAVEGIDTALRGSTVSIADVPRLPEQSGVAFQGFLPGAVFDITPEVAGELLADPGAEYKDVVKPYLDGRDIARDPTQTPGRFTIDFAQMPLESATRYPLALDILREQAKAARESSNSYSRNPRWWQFLWPRPAFREAVGDAQRFIAGSATAKRIFFCWCGPHWRPSNSTNMFALDTDYAMGVLSSRIHTEWARGRSSTLEDRIRYTPSSAYETFPWPTPTEDQRLAISGACIDLFAKRRTTCEREEIGLTELYNLIDEGGYAEVAAADSTLALEVAGAYGWPAEYARDARAANAALLDLHGQILSGERPNSAPRAAAAPDR